ncbi:MAG: type I 3-dehydroquinate dehydratase, partial [Proteocatella sp.]|nr:type I 3-dehydroquinate dehydratase [Proteocatella sp.]
MKTVKVRNIELGSGIPKICVPIVAVTKNDILEQAMSLRSIPADIAEWRVDWYEDVFEMDTLMQTLSQVREALGDMPLLFT